jgi:hypothetical protein
MHKRKKTIIAVAIGVVSLSALYYLFSIVKFIHATNNAPEEMVHYSSSNAGLEFDYPKNWYMADLPNGNHGDMDVKIVITYFTQSPYIMFSSREFDDPTYNDVVCWGINNSSQTWRVLAITTTDNMCSINLEKFEFFDLRDNIFGRSAFHCVDYFKQNAKHGYMFTFCSKEDEWDRLRPIFNQMYNSIGILQ